MQRVITSIAVSVSASARNKFAHKLLDFHSTPISVDVNAMSHRLHNASLYLKSGVSSLVNASANHSIVIQVSTGMLPSAYACAHHNPAITNLSGMPRVASAFVLLSSAMKATSGTHKSANASVTESCVKLMNTLIRTHAHVYASQ